MNLITQNSNGSLTVSSLVIAELFGRPHKNVLRDIKPYCTKLNIELSLRINDLANGKQEKYYVLTESQFLKIMPFVGGNKSFEGQCLLVDEFIRLRAETNNKKRHLDAIRSLLLLDAPDTWVKLYPDSFYISIMNLYGHEFDKAKNKPFYCAQITRRWIYDIVLPVELQVEIDTKRGEERKLQWFTKDNGRQTLLVQIAQVEMIARMSESRADFEANCARAFLSAPLQLTVFK
jgi:phage regulator Rha-like protein